MTMQTASANRTPTTADQDRSGQEGAPRKPRIAIMGEFSVGKSTLCNLLLGAAPLPVRVTATQLPPVWISQGTAAPWREMLDGQQEPVSLDALDAVPLEDTAFLRLFLEAEILASCDLIDMPGISDPNMPARIYDDMLGRADAVLWCTHATQAWRQSEAAMWATVDPAVKRNSLLLITRMDKLLTERDRARVVRRVARETAGQFAAVFPVSLTQALGAGYDAERWMASGAEAFSQHLLDLLGRLSGQDAGSGTAAAGPAAGTLVGASAAARAPAADASAASPAVRPVRPTRIRPARARTTPRPTGGPRSLRPV